ncbi:MAG TPA: ribosomal protein S18-alanine N-acetyltransferase [Candidatus Krumholzibacteriaceae bacterium]|jgi:ribosomal-protein-alanine N-acetyltransferase|nr:ribosomal protein S18-alanine N-acetyltransferase [Candidatus Krumholzibacteriaceae bacterium]
MNKAGTTLQTTFNLRQYQPADLDKVMRINQVCLPENYSPDFFIDLYDRFPATFIVAEAEGKVVGYIMCRIETNIFGFGNGKKGHVISIAVLPEYQHSGIGKALMLEALQNMQKFYKARECYLEVRVSNVPAIAMYKNLGFTIRRTLHGYYADNESAYMMTKKL